MNKLIHAGFTRLWKSLSFRLCILGSVLASSAAVLEAHYTLVRYSTVNATIHPLVQTIVLIGFICAIFISMFVGTEYSDGTIRNKLIAGHRRIDVYISNLIVCIAATIIVFIAGIGAAVLCRFITLGSLGADGVGYERILQLLCFSIGICAAYSAIALAFTMNIHRRSLSIVISFMVAFLLLFAAAYTNKMLEEPEVQTAYLLVNEYGVPLEIEETPNPLYVSGTARDILEFILDFLPSGQSIQISNLDTPRPARLFPLSALMLVLSSAMGAAIFWKKDIK